MGLLNSNKQTDKKVINGEEMFKVKLALSADPDIVEQPKDIVLVLDSSGSMQTDPLNALKTGVNHFLDIVDIASDGVQNGKIGGGSRIGMVSFATTAKIDNNFTTSVAEIKVSVASLKSGGSTNHADAFLKAKELFDPVSTNEKVLILFTDGVSNTGFEGFKEAETLRNMGVTIFCIGLNRVNQPIKLEPLEKWVTQPASAFILISPDYQQIEATFDKLTANITKPGATNVVLTDTINDCFEVVSVDQPTKGTAVIVDKKTVRWDIAELGTGTAAEGATFEFTVKHTGKCKGDIPVNLSHTYTDTENNIINLPDPVVTINDAPIPVDVEYYEDCPVPVAVDMAGCDDYMEFNAGDVVMTNLGRILDITATIKNVCPNKNVALAVVVTELDNLGKEYSRGMKTILVPAHAETTCKDVVVKCIKFVLPEELDLTNSPNAICDTRKFMVRLIANYVETGYKCCKDEENI